MYNVLMGRNLSDLRNCLRFYVAETERMEASTPTKAVSFILCKLKTLHAQIPWHRKFALLHTAIDNPFWILRLSKVA